MLYKLGILFVGPFLGGLAVLFVKKGNPVFLKLLLSFSGAYLFALCALHLLPEVYGNHQPLVGLFVLLGFALQISLELFSKGLEHGHMHAPTAKTHQQAFPLGVLVGLSAHAFLESMPLVKDQAQNGLLYGIALHHVPAAFALGSLLMQAHASKKNLIAALLIFALTSPIGYLFSLLLSKQNDFLLGHFDYLMAFVIGIFLHISTTILFESSDDHRFNRYKFLAILTGAGIALIFFFSAGHAH